MPAPTAQNLAQVPSSPTPAQIPNVPLPKPAQVPDVPPPAGAQTPDVPAPAPVAAEQTTTAQAPAPAQLPYVQPEEPKCETKKDLEYYVFRIHMAVSQTEIKDWLPDHITHSIKAAVSWCPEALQKDLEAVATKTGEYDHELDEAAKLAIRTIKAQIESLSSINTIRDIVQNATFTNEQNLHASCLTVFHGLDVTVKGRDTVLECAEKLKRDVTPNHDIIVKDVRRVTELLQSKVAAKFTDAETESQRDELKNLAESIRKAIHADEDRVESAGEEFRRCIFRNAYGLDLGLARIAGHLDALVGNVPLPAPATVPHA